MAFQTGTINNSFELVNKIYGFLISIGWEVTSTLKVNKDADGYDFVFKSPSELGTRDVYIRIASGMTDAGRVTTGDIQHPYSDGYTEYVNGLAYQYFPPGGSENQGLNELGIFGPILYSFDSTNEVFYEINLWNTNATNTGRKRNISSINFNGTIDKGPNFFDGRRFVFAQDGLSTGTSPSRTFARVDLYDNSVVSADLTIQNAITMGTFATDASDNRHVYVQSDNAGSPDRMWFRYDVRNDIWSIDQNDFLDRPPWGSPERGFGHNISLLRRKRVKINGLDHYRWIHASQGFGTTDIAMYNIDTDTWTSLISAPFSMGSSSSGLIGRVPTAVVVSKEMSGYEYDRLYVTRGGSNDDFASIALGDDGYYHTGASWITHAVTPVDQEGGSRIWYYNNYIYFQTGNTSDDIYRWEIPATPEAAGSWENIGSFFDFEVGDGNGSLQELHYHLCNKVHVSEFQTNTYWLFADLDRLVVVVKDAEGRYSYLYTGLYEPYASPVVSTLIDSVSANATSISVENPDIFEVGQKYLIVDNTGASITITSSFGETRDMGASELFTVLSKEGNTMVITRLRNSYSSDSLVGEDPLPLAVRCTDADRAQVLNNINKVDSDDFSDPPWQYYTLFPAVSDSFAATTDVEERSLGTFLHGIVLIDQGDTYTGKEVRGQLKDVYACGTGVANESIINIGSDEYIAFDIDASAISQRIVVGPK